MDTIRLAVRGSKSPSTRGIVTRKGGSASRNEAYWYYSNLTLVHETAWSPGFAVILKSTNLLPLHPVFEPTHTSEKAEFCISLMRE